MSSSWGERRRSLFSYAGNQLTLSHGFPSVRVIFETSLILFQLDLEAILSSWRGLICSSPKGLECGGSLLLWTPWVLKQRILENTSLASVSESSFIGGFWACDWWNFAMISSSLSCKEDFLLSGKFCPSENSPHLSENGVSGTSTHGTWFFSPIFIWFTLSQVFLLKGPVLSSQPWIIFHCSLHSPSSFFSLVFQSTGATCPSSPHPLTTLFLTVSFWQCSDQPWSGKSTWE